MTVQLEVSAELALAQFEAQTSTEVLTALAERAFQAGYVKPSFTEALIKREREFPTGLPTDIPVALPHTDAGHVLKAGLGVATLKNPVSFGEMGGEDSTVLARAVILILVDDPSEQVTVLGKLVNLIQRPGWFDELAGCETPEKISAEFSRLFAR